MLIIVLVAVFLAVTTLIVFQKCRKAALRKLQCLESPEKERALKLYGFLSSCQGVILTFGLAIPLLCTAGILFFIPPEWRWESLAAFTILYLTLFRVLVFTPRLRRASQELQRRFDSDPTLKAYTLGRIDQADPGMRLFARFFLHMTSRE